MTADAPDVVALQEVPLWAVKRLEVWSGMSASWAMTMPALLGPLARRVTAADAVRFRSSFTGQANALLVNPHFELGRHRRVVLNPGLSRADWLLRGGQRRVCHSLEVDVDGESLLLANMHASNNLDRPLIEAEIERGVAFLADDEPCVLCGDFNVPRHSVEGFSAPIAGIDQILVRGAELERGPDAWEEEQRRVGGVVLSDHAPIEAVITSTSLAVRRGLPVLDRFAYLNTGTFGPLRARRSRRCGRSSGGAARGELEPPVLRARPRATRDAARAGSRGCWGRLRSRLRSTTSTTEGCNIVLRGLGIGPGDEVVTTDSEHPGLFGGLVASGATLRIAPIRELPVAEILPALRAQITPRTRLVGISHVSWLNGAVLPVRELAGHGVPRARRRRAGRRGDPGRRGGARRRLLHGVGAEVAARPGGDRRALRRGRAARRLPRRLPLVLLLEAPRVRAPGRRRALRGVVDAAGVDRRAPRRPRVRRCGRERTASTGLGRQPNAAERSSWRGVTRWSTEPGQATLVSWRAEEPEAVVKRLAEQGVVVRDLPGTGLVRASCGYWTSEDDLDRLVRGL